MEFAFTGLWDECDANVACFCLMVLVASEICSFCDGNGGGGNKVDDNEDECNKDGFVVLSLCWFNLLDGVFDMLLLSISLSLSDSDVDLEFLSSCTWSKFLFCFSFSGIIWSVNFTGCMWHPWVWHALTSMLQKHNSSILI